MGYLQNIPWRVDMNEEYEEYEELEELYEDLLDGAIDWAYDTGVNK